MEIRNTKRFKKAYKKLPKKVREQFRIRLTLYVQAPLHPQLHVHKLSGEYRDCWSINISGDYRLVFKLLEGDDVLLLVEIGTHSKLYG